MTLINVCGASFSGTTMLDLMLGHAPDAASCGEIGALYRPKRLDRVAPNCPCGLDPCPRWSWYSTVGEDRFHREAFARWKVRWVIDSTKALAWVFDSNRWAAAEGLRVVNLLIWKSPRAHAYSHWKRGTSLAEARRRFERYHTRFLEMRLPFVSVNYDAFVRKPKDSLAEVCRVVGMDYFAGKERFWTAQPHNLFGNDGTRSQIGRADSSIHPKVEFPTKFVEEFAEFEQTANRDSRCRRIVEGLSLFDVSSTPAWKFFKTDRRPGFQPGYWYQEERFKRISRSYLGRLRPARNSATELVGQFEHRTSGHPLSGSLLDPV